MVKNCFSTYHPTINFLYFTFVILVSIFLYHPVLLCISFLSAMAYSIYLGGSKAIKLNLLGILPIMAISIFINVAANHEGITILTYWGGNPITLESIQFGFAAAAMLAAVVLWFYCYSKVISSDKFVYLFGRILPSLSLIFSMALSFAPRFSAQIKKVSRAQACLGRGVSSGNWFTRARHGMKILSIMATWALESAVDTADSMKARGYGVAKRTAYSIYRFDSRDRAVLILLSALSAFVLAAIFSGAIFVKYFPSFKTNNLNSFSLASMLIFAIVCLLPLILQLKEDIVWRCLISKV